MLAKVSIFKQLCQEYQSFHKLKTLFHLTNMLTKRPPLSKPANTYSKHKDVIEKNPLLSHVVKIQKV